MAGNDGKPPAIVITGPTASGKTALALRLADALPVEIISVDATQVYRGLDIGSAKPEPALLARYPHHLIDILDPADSYSAARFAADAERLMREISRRRRIPMLVGGTMLYFRVLRERLSPLPAADQALRRDLERQANERGWPALHRELQRVDPETAGKLHPNHSQRIQRALEVYRLTGRPLSQLLRESADASDEPLLQQYATTQIALGHADRAVLHQRIETRFGQMLDRGLENEVRALRQRRDLHPGLPSMRAVGYRQVWEYLDGACDRREMILRALAASRQLAKRQHTWLRRWPGLQWLYDESDAAEKPDFANIADKCLKILHKGPIYFGMGR